MNKLIHRVVLVSMIFIGLSILGIYSYRQLPVELYPNSELPTLTVNINSTQELETEYTKNKAIIPIEGAISTLKGVEEITTSIKSRNSTITIAYSSDTDVKFAFLQLEEKMKDIANELPDLYRINVAKSGGSMMSNQIMTLQILGDHDINQLKNLAIKDIQPKLEGVDGVSGVNIFGGREITVEVIYDPEKCKALKISPARIQQLLRNNMSDRTFSGEAYEKGKRIFVNVESEFKHVSDIENIVIGEGPLFLKDVAEIKYGPKEAETYSRVNGKEVLVAYITRSSQVNIIDLSKDLRAEIERLNLELESKGVTILVDNDVSEVMSENINTIKDLGFSGAILAIFILYLFLRNLRIISIVALAIPISILSTFFFFYLGGISINLLTLIGIALAVGMLLDNSIVVLENIFRLRAMGYSISDAAVNGTSEVRKSVIASTATTILVFTPFLFADDYILKLIGEHVGVSIIATLLLSLVVALLLIPMAVTYFMKKKEYTINFNQVDLHSKGVQFYIALLKLAMRRPAALLVTSLVLLAAILTLSITSSFDTLKEIETDQLNVYYQFSSTYDLDRTDKQIRKIEPILDSIPEILQYQTQVSNNEARITIKLKEDFEEMNNKDISTLRSEIFKRSQIIKPQSMSSQALESSDQFRGGNGGDPLMGSFSKILQKMGMGTQREEIIVKGEDYEVMQNYAEMVVHQLQQHEDINNANISGTPRASEAQVFYWQYQMGLQDISRAEINDEIQNFFPTTSSSINFKTEDDEYEIIIKEKEEEIDPSDPFKDKKDDKTRTLAEVKHLTLYNKNENPIPLYQVADVYLRSGRASIKRYNQSNEIKVFFTFNAEINEEKELVEATREDIAEVIKSVEIPAGVAIEIKHTNNDIDDLTFLVLATFVLIYMILASIFESFSAPLVLMFTIPLAAIGSLLGLYLSSNSLMNVNVFIGFVILIGIVVNNSIILLDYTKQLRKAGMTRTRAVMTASISRLRPILITATTTIIAMIPLALGEGEFVASLGASFAITVIGGLLTSTFLTLVIIPTLYCALEEALKYFLNLSPWIKGLEISTIFAILITTYLSEESIWWNIAYTIATLILVPAIYWYLFTSLKGASHNIITKEERLEIKVENLVKVYGRESEFMREINSGAKRRVRKEEGSVNRIEIFNTLLWRIPLAIFTGYLALFYFDHALWSSLNFISMWLLIISSIKDLAQIFPAKSKGILRVNSILYWTLPMGYILFSNIIYGESGSRLLIIIIVYFILLGNLLVDRSTAINSNKWWGKWITSISKILKYIPGWKPKQEPFRALKSVNLSIHEGMFGLLGPNGAGKTTFMRILCGILEQSYGKIFINGIDSQEKREELQGIIGYLPQEFGTYENLTTYEYLDYQALLKGLYNKEIRHKRIYDVLQAVHLWERKDHKIGGFSGGMKQRVGIAQTLLHLPRILVVDEPTAGLDPRERIRFRNLLVELSKNRIVLFSTHIIEDIASSCNQVGVISKGDVKYCGTPNRMAEIANGMVWVFEVEADKFHTLPTDMLIVHHIRKGDSIHARVLAAEKPYETARQVTPQLEDAYLWLIRTVKINNNEKIITQ